MAAHPVSHPPADNLRAFGLGMLDDEAAEVLLTHLEICGACRQLAARVPGDNFLQRLREAHASSMTPAPEKRLSGVGRAFKHNATTSALCCAPLQLPAELVDHPQYEILGELARGGMGVVYLARNKLMNRREVLKVIKQDVLDSKGAQERFQREIQAAATLSNPHVVTAYSAWQTDDLLFFAMEFVEGKNLHEVVRDDGPLSVADACAYIQQAAEGLQHALAKGLIHRDIKPHNLMLTGARGQGSGLREGKAIAMPTPDPSLLTPIVKILDFGLAKATSERENQLDLTAEGMMLGTAHYIAPEQIEDAARADIRADIYSLGCTLYFLLTGRPPFHGKDFVGVLDAQRFQEAQPLHLERPDVPRRLAAVVAKMLAKDLARRYQEPVQVVQALEPFVKRQAESAGPGQTASGKKWLWAIAVAAVLFLGLVVTWACGVFRVRTREGILAIRVNEPHPDVYVDGDKVTVAWGEDGKQAEIQVRPGTRKVEVKKEGFAVTGKELTVREDDRELFTARLLPDGRKKRPKEGSRRPAKKHRSPKPGKRFLCQLAGHSSADWRIDGDELVQKSLQGDAVLLFGDPQWVDYDFAVEVKMVAGFNECKVIFRSENKDDSYADSYLFALAGFKNSWHLIDSLDKGKWLWPRPAGRPGSMRKRQWHRAEVRVRGQRGHAFLDGQEIFTFQAGRHPRGRVGLLTAWSRCRFRNLVVKDPKGAILLEGLPDLAAATNAALLTLRGHTHFVWGVAFSPNGRRLASASQDGSVRLWNAKTGRQIRELARASYRFTSLAWSPDGKFLAGCGDNPIITLWDGKTGQIVHTLRGHKGGVRWLAISPDSRFLASASYDKTVKIWDLVRGKDQLSFKRHTHFVFGVAFSPSGASVASASWDRTVKVWDRATGKEQHSFTGHQGDVLGVAFSPNGKRLASASQDGTVRVWNLERGGEEHVLRDARPMGRVFAVAFSRNSQLLVGGSDHVLKFWDVATGSTVAVLRGHTASVFGLAISRDGRRLATAGGDHMVRIWKIPAKHE